ALDAAEASLGGIDVVVVTAGVHASQEALEADDEAFARLAQIDFVGTVRFCECVRRRVAAGARITLAVVGSVAGDRARRSVSLYGATKAGLAHYLDGLELRWRDRGLSVVTIKPGFVRTPMTVGIAEPPFASDVGPVARSIVRAIDRRRRVAYVPGVWRWIMAVIRCLPRSVLRRADL
ncbi:MAG: SDR family NAD(P)-dependent oxidoreductase, partial [Planctomycetes bacterium]|nr:SDR family NAD(P)-dependent oxidoreductase [Planctomycetota bacterium]